MLTANIQNKIKAQAEALNSDFLEKPVSKEKLENLI
jgi:hypothetical protein